MNHFYSERARDITECITENMKEFTRMILIEFMLFIWLLGRPI